MLVRYDNFVFDPHRIEYIEPVELNDPDSIPEIQSKYVNVEAEGSVNTNGINVVFYSGYVKFFECSLKEFTDFIANLTTDNSYEL
jgi:hypothetical protein